MSSASRADRAAALADRLGVPASVATIVAVLVAVPVFGANLQNFDEGIQLLKASLLNDGFALYRDVWADQPPLHAYLLAGWLRAFEPWAGRTQWAGRLLTLALSAAASASLWRLIRRDLGPGAAVAGVALLLTSGSWLALSGTSMIGLPCVCLAVLSADALASTRDGSLGRRLLGAALAGVLLGASLLTKLLTLPVAAVLIGWAVLDRPAGRWSSGAARAAVLAATCAATFFAVAGARGMLSHLDQVLGTGLDGSAAYSSRGRDWSEFARFADRHRAMLLAATVGLLWATTTGRHRAWLPAAWAIACAAALSGHAPLRYHQFAVVQVALAWLAAYGAEAAADGAKSIARRFYRPAASPAADRPIVAGLAALLVAAVIVADAATVRRPPDPSRPGGRGIRYWSAELRFEPLDADLLALTSRAAAGPSTFFSDVAVYAYLSDRPSPPWLAVVTLKRLRTGRLDQTEVLAALDRAAVTDVYLGRYDGRLGDGVDARLAADFDPIYRFAGRVLYRRRDRPALP